MNLMRFVKLAFAVLIAYWSIPLFTLNGIQAQELGYNLPLSLLLGATLMFHEAGHILFMFFGEFMHVLGGSLLQLLIPIICVATFIYQGARYGAGFSLYWLGASAINLSFHIADSQAQLLQLIPNDSLHDWHLILDSMHLLTYDATIARVVLLAGSAAVLTGIIVMVYAAFKEDASNEPISWE